MRRVGDELALRQARALERREHRVEAAREATEVVLAGRVDPVREILRARHAFGRAAQLADGDERDARDEQPEDGGERDAAEADEREHESQARERAVDVAQRQRDLPDAARRRALGQHSHGRPTDADVAEERAAPAGGDGARRRCHGQQRAVAFGVGDVPVGLVELHVAGRAAELLLRQHELRLRREQLFRHDAGCEAHGAFPWSGLPGGGRRAHVRRARAARDARERAGGITAADRETELARRAGRELAFALELFDARAAEHALELHRLRLLAQAHVDLADQLAARDDVDDDRRDHDRRGDGARREQHDAAAEAQGAHGAEAHRGVLST